MSNERNTDGADMTTVAFRVHSTVAHRLDDLAAHAGMGRSAFLRAAVALADQTLTIADVERAKRRGDADAEAERIQREATADLAELMEALSPTPLIPSMN